MHAVACHDAFLVVEVIDIKAFQSRPAPEVADDVVVIIVAEFLCKLLHAFQIPRVYILVPIALGYIVFTTLPSSLRRSHSIATAHATTNSNSPMQHPIIVFFFRVITFCFCFLLAKLANKPLTTKRKTKLWKEFPFNDEQVLLYLSARQPSSHRLLS